jgi:zinc transport system substrate-binding protein
MNKQRKSLLYLALMVMIVAPFLGACQPTATPDANAADKLNTTVSIVPLAYFTERIGGDWVNVNIMVSPGESPHTYEPTPEKMVAVSESPIFFSIGVEYEHVWLPKFEDANPDMMVVDTSTGIERIPVINEIIDVSTPADDAAVDDHDEDDDHAEGEDADHDHEEGNLDPHVWLSPENGKIIAENILNGLIEVAPEHEADFRSNYDALIGDIDAMDAQIRETLAGTESQPFMVFHPAWGYFAQQYSLEQIAVQVGGQDPSAKELAQLVELAREQGITVVFIQPGFNTASAEALAQEIGGAVAIADPLAADWLENLNTVANAFSEAIGK